MIQVKSRTNNVLISGAGIAGLALAIQLKKKGWQPEIIDIAKGVSTSGYTMDIFGTGWDVLAKMGLLDQVLALPKTIKSLEVHDQYAGRYTRLEIDNLAAFAKDYTYIRRPDLEKILHVEATKLGIPIQYDRSIAQVETINKRPRVTLSDDTIRVVDLVVGADGISSRVRDLVFGDAKQFQRHLGMYVAGFEVYNNDYVPDGAFAIVEGKTSQMACYPSRDDRLNIIYVLHSPELPRLSAAGITSFVQENIKDDNQLGSKIMSDPSLSPPVYFSPVTQIIMPEWRKGRVVLVGDSCGCLTFMAGQGSHMALASAYVLADELAKHPDDVESALASYQQFMQPHVSKKQSQARRLAKIFVPHHRSKPSLRRRIVKTVIYSVSRKLLAKFNGSGSILAKYKTETLN